MKKYKIAAILMIIHGGFMEIGGILAMIPALMFGIDKLYYYNCPYDVFTASRNHGWNTCRYGIGFNIDAILW